MPTEPIESRCTRCDKLVVVGYDGNLAPHPCKKVSWQELETKIALLNKRLSASIQSCEECGALIVDLTKHLEWHENISDEIGDAGQAHRRLRK